MAEILASLGPEFMAQFLNSVQGKATEESTRAEDEPNPLDGGALDSASFQDQINDMNNIGASHSSVAPFDEVEVTGVKQYWGKPFLGGTIRQGRGNRGQA